MIPSHVPLTSCLLAQLVKTKKFSLPAKKMTHLEGGQSSP